STVCALPLWTQPPVSVPEREHTFFRPRPFLIPPTTAQRRVSPVLPECIQQGLRPQQPAAARRADIVGVDAASNRAPIRVCNQPRADLGHKPVPKGNHFG